MGIDVQRRKSIQRRHRNKLKSEHQSRLEHVQHLSEENQELKLKYQAITRSLVCSRCGKVIKVPQLHQCQTDTSVLTTDTPSWIQVGAATIAAAGSCMLLKNWEVVEMCIEMGKNSLQAVMQEMKIEGQGVHLKWGITALLWGQLARGWIRLIRNCHYR